MSAAVEWLRAQLAERYPTAVAATVGATGKGAAKQAGVQAGLRTLADGQLIEVIGPGKTSFMAGQLSGMQAAPWQGVWPEPWQGVWPEPWRAVWPEPWRAVWPEPWRAVWIEPRLTINPYALFQRGVSLDRIVFVETGPTEAHWAALHVVKSQVFDVVVLSELSWPERALRRLQLATEQTRCKVFLLNSEGVRTWIPRVQVLARR